MTLQLWGIYKKELQMSLDFLLFVVVITVVVTLWTCGCGLTWVGGCKTEENLGIKNWVLFYQPLRYRLHLLCEIISQEEYDPTKENLFPLAS